MIDGVEKTCSTSTVISDRMSSVRPIQIKYSVGKFSAQTSRLLALVFIHLFQLQRLKKEKKKSGAWSSRRLASCLIVAQTTRCMTGKTFSTERVQYTMKDGNFDPVSPAEPSASRKKSHIYRSVCLLSAS